MTSPLRMKRPTTARGKITPCRTAASIVCLLLAWGNAHAQQSPKMEKTLTFVRDPAVQPQQAPPAAFTVPPPTLFPIPNREPATARKPRSDAPPPASEAAVQQIAQNGSYSIIDDEASLDLPGPGRMFKRVSERDVFDEIRLQARRKPTIRAAFPEDTPVSTEKYAGRNWSPMIETVEPNYIGHGRLYFEQPNFERGGWDFGIVQPIVSLGVFYADMALLPYQVATRPLQRFDSSAGKCLPGDPTPLFLYPPELSLTGATAEAATVVGLLVLFPR